VGLSHVKAAFPGVEVKPVQEGYSVRLSGGREIFVTQQGELKYDPTDFQAAYGRAPGEGETVLGEYRRVGQDGVVWLAKDADPGIVHHEAFHAAMDMVLSPKERDAVLTKYGSEEDAARAYADWTPAKTNSWFTKILSFFSRIYSSFRPSWESAFEAVRGGEAFQREVNPATDGGPQFAAQPTPGTPTPGPTPTGPVIPPATTPPRVEGNVESLLSAEKAQAVPHEELARETPAVMSTATAARTAALRGQPDAYFLDKVQRGKALDQFESQELDSRTRGKYEGLDQAQQDLDAARATGSPNVGPLSQDLLAKTLDYIAAQRAYVNDGTGTARALAARAKVQAADMTASNPDTFMRQLFKQIPGLSDQQAASLLDTFRNDPGSMQDAVRAALKPSFRQKFFEAWKAGMLGPASWLAKAGGDTAAQALSLARETIGTGLEQAAAKISGRVPDREWADVYAHMKGLQDGWSYGWDRFTDRLANESFDPTGDLDVRGTGAIGKVNILGNEVNIGKAVRFPYRVFEAITDAFGQVSGRSELWKQALRRSIAEARQKGLDPEAPTTGELLDGSTINGSTAEVRAQQIRDIIDNGKGNEFPEIRKAMVDSAKYNTYQSDLQGIWQKINQVRNSPGIGGTVAEAVLPFYKTPLNITGTILEHTPLNFPRILKKMYSGELKGGAAYEELAKPIIGTALGMTMAMAAKEGLVTGGGPADPKQRDELTASGWQPYSFRLGDQYVSYHRLEPLGSIIGMAADLMETKDEQAQSDIVKKIVGSIGVNLTNKTFLKGLSDFTGAIHDPIRAGGLFIRSLEGSLVPSVVGRLAQVIDPTVRDTSSATNLSPLISRVPFASETLAPKVTGTGEPEVHGGPDSGVAGRLWSALTPFGVSTSDPASERVARLFQDVGFHPPTPEQSLTIPGLHRGVKVQLTPEERQYLSGVDARVTERVKELAQDPRFLQMDPLMQKYYLQRMYLTAGMTGRRSLMMQPDFQARAQDALGQFRGSRQPTSPLSPGGGTGMWPSAGANVS